ncbi:PrpF domain-containing protein [Microbacterium horticulturae]|uniref:PrpF domain-containing protein n=1 Tax=Microbacterium horticulturae TaxID=3028316 RepID=A0ABY8BZZ1_9MICO|nr:PrpF domain-containing protein [Microbacterium sp. KACC 23027]WEG07983.1 PrpF domain-containing protein [Microbacterium sp. KACC 23027]
MPADPIHDGLPCMLMRGGTSKGAFFLAEDVPADPEVRDELMLRIMGSPDPTQIDGIGGAHPLTSKVAVVSASTEPDVDLDYLFLQVAVDAPQVSDRQTCGNLLAAVGPFALERGLISASGDRATVRIRLVNTGDVATASFAVCDGRPDYDGDAQIDGVPGTACPIDLRVAGSGPLLPTGNAADTVAGHRVTLVDNGMPVVLMDAVDFGVAGTESPAELEENAALRAEVEKVRRATGPLFGLGDVTGQSVPKMFLLSPPRGEGAITTRAFIPHRVHTAIGVLMAASVAAGIRIPGAVGADLARLGEGRDTVLEHPAGAFTARVEVGQDAEGVWRAASTSLRTARQLFDGRVFARPHL